MKQLTKSLKKQAGLSLLEVITSLLVVGLVISGAIALFGSADSSQKANQMQSDVVALRSAVKGLYAGQGGFGVGNLNAVLKNAKKIPGDLSVSAATPPVITHSMNGTVTVTGATSNFTLAITNIPTDVCVALLTQAMTGWTSIQVQTATMSTFPIDPATAATNCATTDANSITFTGA